MVSISEKSIKRATSGAEISYGRGTKDTEDKQKMKI